MSYGKEFFRELMETQQYSDITLVSHDQYSFKAHKFMLSACSSVFKNILDQNPQHTSIFLRGIQHQEIESILQFIYLGEVKFHQERMKEFLNVAKDLDLKEIVGYIDELRQHQLLLEKSQQDAFSETATQALEKIELDEESEKVNQQDAFSETATQAQEKIGLDEESEKESKKKSCNKEYVSKFPCQQCNYQAKRLAHLQVHVEAIHGTVKYSCPQCNYKTTSNDYLKRHKDIHMGLNYPCQECDYTATKSGHLKEHVQSIHEGVKYPCQKCDFRAKHTANLRYHVKSKHEGIKYKCQHCDYQVTRATNLRRHVQLKH